MASYVKGLKVNYGQGYLFSKPISETEFKEFIETRKYQDVLNALSSYEDEKKLSGKVEEKSKPKEDNMVKIESKSAEDLANEIKEEAKKTQEKAEAKGTKPQSKK